MKNVVHLQIICLQEYDRFQQQCSTTRRQSRFHKLSKCLVIPQSTSIPPPFFGPELLLKAFFKKSPVSTTINH